MPPPTPPAGAPVHVLGLDGPAGRDPRLAALLDDAAVVVAGIPTLEALGPVLAARPAPPRTIPIAGPLDAVLDAVAASADPVLVLASGDPGWFGVGRALAHRVGPERLRVHPAASSVSRAWARVGLPWDDARVVSAHARGTAGASGVLAALLAGPKVAVLTAPDVDPSFLAAAYARIPGAPARTMAVLERLGEEDEAATTGTPGELAAGSFADPNVLLAWSPARAADRARVDAHPPRLATRWALPEDAFAHRDGMITKREVRAVALAALGPGPGDLVWDVGCGSGSVGIEAARLGAGVIAIDPDPEAVALTQRNAAAHGVEVAASVATAPDALAALPDPAVAFVGGGGSRLVEIVAATAPRARRAVVVTLAAVERIGPVLEALADAGLETEGTLVSASRLRPLAGSHRLDGTNPTTVLVGRRPAG